MLIPKYLQPVVEVSEVDGETFSLSMNGQEKFEVYYSGALETIDDVLYINGNHNSETENVERIFVKKEGSDQMYVIYDGMIHGYNNLFCDEHNANIERPLYQLELDGEILFSIEMTLGYSIDYDDEKEDYDMDEDGFQHVYNRKEKISWEQVKEEGFDWITIQFENEKSNSVFLDLELA